MRDSARVQPVMGPTGCRGESRQGKRPTKRTTALLPRLREPLGLRVVTP